MPRYACGPTCCTANATGTAPALPLLPRHPVNEMESPSAQDPNSKSNNSRQESNAGPQGPQNSGGMDFPHTTPAPAWAMGPPPYAGQDQGALSTITSTGDDGKETEFVTIIQTANSSATGLPAGTVGAGLAKSSPNHATTTAVPIIGSVVGVALLAGAGYFLHKFWRRRQKAKRVESTGLPSSRDMSDQLHGRVYSRSYPHLLLLLTVPSSRRARHRRGDHPREVRPRDPRPARQRHRQPCS